MGLVCPSIATKHGKWMEAFLLRLFGAKIHSTAIVYSSARVYYPSNLEMDEYSCLASEVDCYNVAPIKSGRTLPSHRGLTCVQLAMT